MRRCQDAGDELEASDVLGVGLGVASVVLTGMRADVDVHTDVVEGSGSDDDVEGCDG